MGLQDKINQAAAIGTALYQQSGIGKANIEASQARHEFKGLEKSLSAIEQQGTKDNESWLENVEKGLTSLSSRHPSVELGTTYTTALNRVQALQNQIKMQRKNINKGRKSVTSQSSKITDRFYK